MALNRKIVNGEEDIKERLDGHNKGFIISKGRWLALHLQECPFFSLIELQRSEELSRNVLNGRLDYLF